MVSVSYVVVIVVGFCDHGCSKPHGPRASAVLLSTSPRFDMLCLISEVEPILLRRVKQDEPREEDEAPVEDEAPDGDEVVPEAEREDAPVDDEAKVQDGAVEPLGREADEEIDVEIAGGGSYKLRIKFVGGADLEILAAFPLLGLFGKIRATSPKFIASCDVWPEAPTFSLSAANMFCVATGLIGAAVGRTLGFALAGARL